MTKRVVGGGSLQYSMPELPAFRAGTFSGITGSAFPAAALLNSLLCPTIAAAGLPLCALLLGVPVTGYYMVLAVLAFLAASQTLDDIDLFMPWSTGEFARVARSVITSWALVVAVVVVLGFATGLGGRFDQSVILAWFAATPLLLLVAIKVARSMVRRLIDASADTRTAIIVGANHVARVFAARLEENPYLNVRLRGYFDDRSPDRVGVPDRLRGTLTEVPEYVRRNGIHCVYIALPMTAQPRVLRLIRELRDTTASVYFLPDFFVFDLMQARFDYLSGMPVAAIRETPFHGLNAVIKRAMDLVLGSAILVLAAPVMAAIAVVVRLDSPGPVLFRQRRYGIDGREIVILKFRTMRVCEDGDRVVQAQRGDPRLTRVGAFLRRTSLDELPQFFNVLAGSMSIVGPRPHAVAHNEQYRKLISGYMLRHKAKPGITGWAQVNGCRGETETVEKMRRRVELDLDYLANWSPSLDLWIVARTLPQVWNDGNAY